ncbi:MAG: MATE family efflux transporter [Clostridiales bacterium]|nr:MATE family efflux transporter [Clostridiales bacterium]
MIEGSLIAVITTISIPQVVTMLIDSIYSIVDTFYVSRIGDAAIAAVGVNDSLMMLIRAISMGFGVGSASFISRALGAKKDEDASRAAVTTLFTAVGTLCVAAFFGSLFLLPLVNFLGATDTVRPYSMQYARWILLSSPITAANTVLAQLLRAEGSTLYSMIGMSSGCLINVAIDPLFIYNLGFGVAGAAMAKGICNSIALCILLWPFIRRKCVIKLRPSYFSPRGEIYAEIARMGVPTMIRTGMMSIATILINNTAASFGDAVMASVSVANKSLRAVYSGIMGFSQGFQPVAGYCYGAKKYDRVIKAFSITMIIGAVAGIVLGVGLGFFAPQVIGVFSGDPDVMEIGLILIRTQSISLIPHVWVMIGSGFFQALGMALKAAVLGLSRQLFVLIPCVILLSRLFGAVGLACAQAVADMISLVLAAFLVIPTIRELNVLKKKENAP